MTGAVYGSINQLVKGGVVEPDGFAQKKDQT